MATKLQTFNPRQVMNRKDFEIQHKRDTYLHDVELHHHDFYEIYFLVSGDVTYSIEGRIYHVRPGDVLFVNPRELHQVFIRNEADPYERYVLWIDGDMLERMSTATTNLARCLDQSVADYSNQLRVPIEYKNEIRKLMDDIYRESDNEGYGGDIMQTSLIAQLMVLLNRLADLDAESGEEVAFTSTLVARVIDYVNLHFGEVLSLDDIAEKMYVSKYHLSHEFRKKMGTGVYHYIQKKRVQIARQMLASGEKPNDVYKQCGFSDYAGFYRAFTAEYGVGPREYVASTKKEEQDED
ncbi:MAG: helix-turn-helix domain-containing protein [Lachnospiraceae bacterium]|nr:helix-turn-helix domain-containing protein [Lachnospiraceae bacterium]